MSNDVKFRVSVDANEASKELKELGAAVESTTNKAEGLAGAGGKAADSTDKLGGSAKAAGDLLKNLGATIAAGFTFEQLVQAAAQMESIRAGLQAVTGDAARTSKEFEFIRTTANKVGADVTEVGRAFLGLAAATRGTAVEGEPTRQVFEAIANAMGKAGKSSAETQNALTAIAQIASKGTVSMEELRGQLGEALPGALQAAANGLGVTTQDLIKLVESGQVAAEDLFPALTKGLNDLYGAGGGGAQTLSQELTNVKNAFVDLATNIGEAGGTNALKTFAEVAQAALVYLDDTLIRTGKSIGVLAGAVATLDFSGVSDAFAEIEAEGRDKLLRAAQHNEVMRQSIEATGDEALRAALKTKEAQKATEASGAAAESTAGSYTKLSSAYSKVMADMATQIEGAEKVVVAREAEGRASMAMAQAFGTETEQRQAAVAARQADAAALTELARLRQTEVEVMRAELQAKQAYIEQEGQNTEQRRKEIADLQQKIALRQSDAEKAAAQAQAAQLSAAQAQAEAAAQADNSARVNELAEAYQRAQKALEDARQARAAGIITAKELTAAELEAGKAAHAYRDALKDQSAAIKATSEAKAADMNLQQMALKVAIEEQRAIAAVARARGDNYTATQAENEIRRLEIEMVKLSAEAKRAEAKAQLAAVEAKRAELEASNQLTPAKRAELDASIAKAQAMQKEADILEITAKKMGELNEITQRNGAASASAASGADSLAAGFGRVGEAADRASGKVERYAATVAKAQKLTGDGFATNPDGSAAGTFNNNMPTDMAFKVMQAANRGDYSGLTLEDAKKAYEQARVAKEWIDALPAGRASAQAMTDAAGALNAARNALEAIGARDGAGSGINAGGVAGRGRSGLPGAGGTPVNININGRSLGTVNTASDADASSLEEVLRQLANDATRT